MSYICENCLDDVVIRIDAPIELKDLPKCGRCNQEMEYLPPNTLKERPISKDVKIKAYIVDKEPKDEDLFRKKHIAIQILEEFETLLNEYNITIPDADREGSEDEARLFGEEYYTLEDKIIKILGEKDHEKAL